MSERCEVVGRLILTLAVSYALLRGELGVWPQVALVVSLLTPRT